jgi:hypothetical protein
MITLYDIEITLCWRFLFPITAVFATEQRGNVGDA